MIDVDTEIIPPGLDTQDDDGDGGGSLFLSFYLSEVDDTQRGASANLSAGASDVDIADAMIRVMEGLAVMRGPGLQRALRARLRDA